ASGVPPGMLMACAQVLFFSVLRLLVEITGGLCDDDVQFVGPFLATALLPAYRRPLALARRVTLSVRQMRTPAPISATAHAPNGAIPLPPGEAAAWREVFDHLESSIARSARRRSASARTIRSGRSESTD